MSEATVPTCPFHKTVLSIMFDHAGNTSRYYCPLCNGSVWSAGSPSSEPYEGNSGQWCLIHDCHQDDPAHDYRYEVCEGHHRDATAAENELIDGPTSGLSALSDKEGEGGA